MNIVRYVGPGFVVGIPARDLTEEEVEAAGGLEVVLGIRSPHSGGALYELVEDNRDYDNEQEA